MPFLKRRRFVSVIGRRSKVPDGVWLKCPGCDRSVTRAEVDSNFNVCPHCGYHYLISATRRIELMTDPGSFEARHTGIDSGDPLSFVVEEVDYSYPKKFKRTREKSGMHEAIVTGVAKIEEAPVSLAVMDFKFMGGSMGSVVGEKICRAADDAVRERIPFVSFAASGGARMEEGILSLMQMAKTCDAVRALNEAGVPYISVMTHPTTGGVFASFSSLGDVILAEPGAHIGFAGPRLIEGALRVKLPEGFQKAEYQFENGYVDQIVSRTNLRTMIAKLIRYLAPKQPESEPAPATPNP
jgi:acetyl-CoA carboxylase carboxyl transferase subunit beta